MAAPSTAAAGTMVNTGKTALGTFLVDSRGFTLYLFEADKTTTSTCTGQCAVNWPPLLTHGTPAAGAGVTAAMLGTTARADGSTQVTYNGHPLYNFVADKNAGDTKGEGVMAFGANWYVVAPSGSKIDNS